MTKEQFRTALTELFSDVVTSKDGQYTIADGASATVFASFTGETLAISRVTRIAVNGDLVTIETARSERYVLECSTVRGFKADLSGKHSEERNAGFGRP